MATTAAISVEQYLNDARYEYSEYLDGVIQDKYPVTAEGMPMVSDMHGLLVGQICLWFGQHAREWRVRPGVEIHTRITPSRFRLPDVSINRLGPATKSFQVDPPLIAIEVLSPGNSAQDLHRKLEDYQLMAIPYVWIIDPESRVGWSAAGTVLIEQTRFSIPGTPIYLDLPELFAQYDELDQAAEEERSPS